MVALLVSIEKPTPMEMVNTRESRYIYMEDLMALDPCRASSHRPIPGVIMSPSPCWGLEGLSG